MFRATVQAAGMPASESDVQLGLNRFLDTSFLGAARIFAVFIGPSCLGAASSHFIGTLGPPVDFLAVVLVRTITVVYKTCALRILHKN